LKACGRATVAGRPQCRFSGPLNRGRHTSLRPISVEHWTRSRGRKRVGKAMTHSSCRDPKIKAIAEVLAMIADADPKPNHPPPDSMSDVWLWKDATEFCTALDRYAGREGARSFGAMHKSAAPMHLKSYQIDGRLLRTGAANFSATGLKRQDNDLGVIENAEAAAAFKRAFDARFAAGETLPNGANR
jgi:phosphatidylserine/phosphatidylglycerophosphate/cardiolipin synthase-like enzyme